MCLLACIVCEFLDLSNLYSRIIVVNNQRTIVRNSLRSFFFFLYSLRFFESSRAQGLRSTLPYEPFSSTTHLSPYSNPTCRGYNALLTCETKENVDAKRPNLSSENGDEIVEADIELDDSVVVKPDNDPPQKMGSPSVEVTEEMQDAVQIQKLAMDAISDGYCYHFFLHLTKYFFQVFFLLT
ncbi:uncharacterized protein LOC119980890 [Tripterygium wilfordii]|uniref:uncharacterized protein LOC119980890 n=1 Tax=Tripterygium wilfordii TaxID=458696 RepID=UPI0018F8116A|nr:uncharacterized protein LOC119980890 [Tripterygium wilfordii]